MEPNPTSSSGRAAEPAGRDERVLVLAPTGRDSALAASVLRDGGVRSVSCGSMTELCEEIRLGAGAILVAEEALVTTATMRMLVDALDRQPAWSDLPVILFSRRSPAEARAALPVRSLGNVTMLERPASVRTVRSVVEAALRSRRRQYEVRTLLGQLEDASRKKDDFLAMLGHELRNPLGAIQLTAALMEADATRDLPRRLAVIARQTRNLTRIVDDLLDVSRLLRGKIELRRENVDLNEIAQRAVLALATRAAELGKTIRIEPAGIPLYCHADPVRLEQVALNLIDNAFKYTGSGGRVSVRVRASGRNVCIEVQDDGIGIPGGMHELIFEPFEQVRGAGGPVSGGLGLGLPLVKSLVELHGGSVRVESAGSGCGSTFRVELPASSPSPARGGDGDGTEPKKRATRSLRILIVEDNPDALETLLEILAGFGHEVRYASDGLEGLRAVQAYPPDVALLDLGLPGIDGFQLARRIRSSPDLGGTRLIAMTGFGRPEDRKRALACGFDHHLVKPLDLDELERLLHEAAATPARARDGAAEPRAAS